MGPEAGEDFDDWASRQMSELHSRLVQFKENFKQNREQTEVSSPNELEQTKAELERARSELKSVQDELGQVTVKLERVKEKTKEKEEDRRTAEGT
jgi:hypothetical protein